MKIIKVKMLKDMCGSPDGITVREYDKGKEYDLPEDLANSFLKLKVANSVSRQKT